MRPASATGPVSGETTPIYIVSAARAGREAPRVVTVAADSNAERRVISMDGSPLGMIGAMMGAQ